MIGESERERYIELLQRYMRDQDESHLLAASDLGSGFVKAGIPVEDVAELHEWSLAQMEVDCSAEDMAHASRPFMELMIAYSLEFQRQVDSRLATETELRMLNEELTQSVRKLEIYQRVFDALPLGVSVFRQRDRSMPGSLEFVLGNPAAEETRVRIEKEAFAASSYLDQRSLDDDQSLSGACVDAMRRGKPIDLGVSSFENETGRDIELQTRIFPLFEDHVGLHVEDVTERRELEAQLQRAQKMELVGQLAGGVAHDFNNVLTTIFGFAEFAAEQLEETSPIRSDIGEVLNAAERAAALTRQLLSFSRRHGTPRVIDANTQIEAVERMIRSLLEEDTLYSVQYADDLWPIRMDPGALEQVIINLVINARDAISTGGRISIQTENVQIHDKEPSATSFLEPGEYVAVSVGDDGMGMGQELQDKIFDPFFTTKAPEQGTGLGLYICSDLVAQAGGDIQIESRVGEGSLFRVLLPRISGKVDGFAESRKKKKVYGSETILLVEDDEGVRRSVSRSLLDSGYEVLSASCGDEAIRISEGRLSSIDLLLTDIVMPESDGRLLACHLKSLRPDLKVLFMSGYTGEALDERGLIGLEEDMIQKPFSVESLMRRVRGILDVDATGQENPLDDPTASE